MTERREIETKLRGETLVRKGLMHRYKGITPLRLVPDLNVVKIGGHGVIDYGREVVMPLVSEIGELSKKHKILAVTGGGARVRHILDIGIDLGMPTGVLAELAGKISEQNAVIVTLLLSEWGGSRVKTGDLLDLPTLLHLGLLPVIHGTPPALLMAEVLGAKSCILVKNVDGLFTEDPRINPKAELIEEITAGELIRMDMEDMVLERKMLYLLQDMVNVKEIRVVNGHQRGTIEQAIRGEKVGTVIRA